jgi:hypothetical protein
MLFRSHSTIPNKTPSKNTVIAKETHSLKQNSSPCSSISWKFFPGYDQECPAVLHGTLHLTSYPADPCEVLYVVDLLEFGKKKFGQMHGGYPKVNLFQFRMGYLGILMVSH